MSLTNPTYNELAQMDHFFAGFAIEAVAICYGVVGVVTLALAAYVLGREFWFDLKYETPEISGGIKGGILDTVSWAAGILSAIWILR